MTRTSPNGSIASTFFRTAAWPGPAKNAATSPIGRTVYQSESGEGYFFLTLSAKGSTKGRQHCLKQLNDQVFELLPTDDAMHVRFPWDVASSPHTNELGKYNCLHKSGIGNTSGSNSHGKGGSKSKTTNKGDDKGSRKWNASGHEGKGNRQERRAKLYGQSLKPSKRRRCLLKPFKKSAPTPIFKKSLTVGGGDAISVCHFSEGTQRSSESSRNNASCRSFPQSSRRQKQSQRMKMILRRLHHHMTWPYLYSRCSFS